MRQAPEFPLSAVPAQALPDEARRRRVYAADDQATQRILLRQGLEPDYELRLFENGYELLEAVKAGPRPDLVITDVVMPVMDGYDASRLIHAVPGCADLPILFLTSTQDPAREQMAYASGAAAFLAKPMRKDALLREVRRLLAPAAAPDDSQPLVYAVDDQRLQRQMLEGWLNVFARVRTFDSGEAVIEALQSGPVPDVILMDVEMPGMGGYEACRRIKADPRTAETALLFLTASADPAAEQRAFEAGAADYIAKPLRAAVLNARVRTQLQAQQARRLLEHQVKSTGLALGDAQAKLAQLVQTGINLGREHDRDKLLRQALFGARDISNCQAATLYTKTERNTLRFAMRTSDDPLPSFELPLYEADGVTPVHRFVASHVALSGKTVVIDDIYTETRFDLSGTKKFSEESGMRIVSTLNVPLEPREGYVIGVIQLMNARHLSTGEVIPFDPEIVGFIEALAAQAAVAIENQNLLDAQKALMDSMIQIIAGAIDTKSPYTGGHCERVPELAIMLAERASEVHEGPLADFAFQTDDEWREFRIGAWLHDCGKVTTPEYVVDKATKLETIYNRIHEVRMRFEVLLRDAAIERLEAIHERGMDRAAADAAFEARKAQLIDDFAFVAECNLGGEFMAPQRLERLKAIAQQVWMRHFDDRLGLSHEEMKRVEREPAAALPAPEGLLSDKPRHLFERPPTEALDARYGFKLKVPEHLYNHGEVYNLSIGRGTLTEEERFKINEHIIQTIVMLERMPLPANLKRVPEYAGTHHETLEGTGYPRKLKAEDLSIPSRIMAIADIFEALTASDRPYKKAKTLSESIRILHQFKRERHIDPVLFDLFLSSGVYKAYAERFLEPSQIDEVDVAAYLGPVD